MNEFSQYVKIIGKGKRAGKYLDQTQAHRAFQLLLDDQATPEQVGAFLMLLRVREESSEELAGFVQACREYNNPEFSELGVDLDLGCYAGKRRHLPWFVLAVMTLAQNGYKVFLHGSQEPDSQRLYVSEVFRVLGLPMAESGEGAHQYLSKYGFAYADLKTLNPKLDNLLQMRALFGLRSPANTLARMLNPTQAKASFHGVFHRDFDERHIETAQLLNDDNVSCLRGEGGEVEMNPERPVTQHFWQNSERFSIEFPALLPSWQIKPRALDCEDLQRVWTGELAFEYGTQATIGTIATMMCLLQPQNSEQALESAAKMWHNRNPLPFSELFN